MKRKKGSIAPARASRICNKGKGKVDEAESHDELYPYFDNLPSQLTALILLLLPIKSLLICKCVCKIWKTIISESHFVKSHFEQSPVSLMIRRLHGVSRTLYLLEWEPDKFEIGTNNHMNLELILKLPLRDSKSYREKNNVKSYKEIGDEIKNKSKRPYIASNSVRDKFNIVNSCNGLLCLSEPTTGNPLVICNPVTGEFIRLPEATKVRNWNDTACATGQEAGFGFHPKTDKYKVIHIWRRRVGGVNGRQFERVILEIHTLGTPSWRNIEVDPQISFSSLMYPTCVNGALHWIRSEGWKRSILSFCLESERLQSLASPIDMFGNHNNGIHDVWHISMGELKGFLYICDSNYTMWVMNEYGIGESWTKVYNIDTLPDPYPLDPHHTACFLIKQFEEGAAVLLHHSWDRFNYYDPKNYGFKVFQIHGPSPGVFEVIPHIPSLISLKDVMKGGNIEVLNIHSRCAKFKLREEKVAVSLSQQIV